MAAIIVGAVGQLLGDHVDHLVVVFDPAFHLDRHLHHVGLPQPSGREALQALVSDRMSTPLDLSMAPWQFDLVDGYLGGSALVCRIHHCVEVADTRENRGMINKVSYMLQVVG
mgnify:CR=1 FL=1